MTSQVSSARYAGAIGLFALGATTQYVGAAIAVGVFALVPAVAVAWWRITLAAAVMVAWRRPWRVGRAWWPTAATFGVALAAMNVAFYFSIDRIPLGTAVSLEFLGPLTVAGLTGRRWTQRLALLAAGLGVVSIGGFGVDWEQPGTALGVAAALLAGAFWGIYVTLGGRLARRAPGADVLTVGLAAGAVVFAPLALLTPSSTWTDPHVLGLLLAVAVLSSVIPYVADQLNFGALPPATFAILLALLPATSVVVGALLLRQIPAPGEAVGLALISLAVLLANLPGGPRRPDAGETRPVGSGDTESGRTARARRPRVD